LEAVGADFRALAERHHRRSGKASAKLTPATIPAYTNALSIHASENFAAVFSNELAWRDARADIQSGRLNASA
jgi:hypothetical protein